MKQRFLRWAIVPVVALTAVLGLNAQVEPHEVVTDKGIVAACYIYQGGVIVGMGNTCLGSEQTCRSNPCD